MKRYVDIDELLKHQCAYEDEDNCIGKSCNEGVKAWLESEVTDV